MTQTTRLLKYVRTHGGYSAYQIAGRLKLDPASVASLLKKLVDRGLLVRVNHIGPKYGYGYYAA